MSKDITHAQLVGRLIVKLRDYVAQHYEPFAGPCEECVETRRLLALYDGKDVDDAD